LITKQNIVQEKVSDEMKKVGHFDDVLDDLKSFLGRLRPLCSVSAGAPHARLSSSSISACSSSEKDVWEEEGEVLVGAEALERN
jgi:hypothetical protein